MCFYKITKRKKATEDIVVYKLMTLYPYKKYSNELRVMSSVFHNSEKFPDGYTIGDVIEAAIRYTRIPALNAFIIDNLAGYWLEGQVVHAYKNKRSPVGIFASVKLKIPAGNYYWEDNTCDEIVSTSMIIEEIEYDKNNSLLKNFYE